MNLAKLDNHFQLLTEWEGTFTKNKRFLWKKYDDNFYLNIIQVFYDNKEPMNNISLLENIDAVAIIKGECLIEDPQGGFNLQYKSCTNSKCILEVNEVNIINLGGSRNTGLLFIFLSSFKGSEIINPIDVIERNMILDLVRHEILSYQ